MIKNILSLLLCLFCLSLYSQDISVEENSLSLSLDIMHPDVQSDGDIDLHTVLTNNSNSKITIEWERVVNTISDGWSSAVCIGDQCYSPGLSANDFSLPAGATSDVYIHIYPGQFPGAIDMIVAGLADIDLVIADADDSSNTVTINFQFDITATSIKELTQKAVKLYPNPTTDFFMLDGDAEIEFVEVYNLLGRKVREFVALEGRTYDVSDLHSGFYLVRLMAGEESVIKTINLSKR